MMPWNKNDAAIADLWDERRKVMDKMTSFQTDLDDLRAKIPEKSATDMYRDTLARLEALEGRTARLWALMTEESAAGRPKLSRFGRALRGRLRS